VSSKRTERFRQRFEAANPWILAAIGIGMLAGAAQATRWLSVSLATASLFCLSAWVHRVFGGLWEELLDRLRNRVDADRPS